VSWSLVTLGEIAENCNSKRIPLKQAERLERVGGYDYYGASGVIDKIDDYLFDGDYLLIGEDGNNLISRSSPIAFHARGKFWVNNHAHVLKSNGKADLGFLAYYINSINLEPYVTGSAQPKLNKKNLDSIKIPLPPLEEQKRIAAILDKADSVRRKRQQAIDLADDFLRSVFLDMFGDPISNPKGWEVKKLKEISSKIASGNTPKGGSKNYVDEGITFLRSQNVWKNKLLLDDVVYIDEKTHESMSKSSLKHKDILMTKTGRINTENSSLGRAALYLGDDGKANLNGHVYFIRLVENVLHEFVVFILTTKEYRDYIRSVCVGGIDKRQLNKDHLEEFPIIYPPKEMQEQFVEKVNIARSMLEKAKSGLKESEQMFNGLSQKAFAGDL